MSDFEAKERSSAFTHGFECLTEVLNLRKNCRSRRPNKLMRALLAGRRCNRDQARPPCACVGRKLTLSPFEIKEASARYKVAKASEITHLFGVSYQTVGGLQETPST
jgi:hypothetical protein